MAGERSLPIQEYPDDLQVLTFHLAETATEALDQVVWTSDRDTIIDSAWVTCTTGGTVSADLLLNRGIFTATTEDTVGEMITAARAITVVENFNGATVAFSSPLTLATNADGAVDNNVIESGQFVVANFSGVWTGVTNLRLHLRVRSKRR